MTTWRPSVHGKLGGVDQIMDSAQNTYLLIYKEYKLTFFFELYFIFLETEVFVTLLCFLKSRTT